METAGAGTAGSPHYEAKTRYFGEVAEQYDAARASKRRWRSEQEIVAELVRRYMEPGDVVLDVPFGTGRFAGVYADAGLEVEAVDVSPDMLDAAVRRLGGRPGHIRFTVGDAACLHLPDASVDHVVCVRLLGHLPPEVAREVLSEFRRVARKTVIAHLPVRDLSLPGLARRALLALPAAPLALGRRALRMARKGARRLLGRGRGGHGTTRPKVRHPAPHTRQWAAMAQQGPWAIRDVITRSEGTDAVWAIATPVRFFVLRRSEPVR